MKTEIQDLVDGIINAVNNLDIDVVAENEYLGHLVNVSVPLVDSTFQKLLRVIENLEQENEGTKTALTGALGTISRLHSEKKVLDERLEAAMKDCAWWAAKALFKGKD